MSRHKPNKPRRDRPARTHNHGDGFEIDTETFAGYPVDGKILAELIGSALEGCTSCQDPLLTLLVEDVTTTARLVSVACVAVHEKLGGLPSSLLDHDPTGVTASEFQRVARVGVDVDDEDLLASRMWCEVHDMTPKERRAAANTAIDLLAGLL
jgi:hypothetical protein